MARAVAWYQVTRARPVGGRATCADAVAVEEPLEIRVDGETVATTMRTPGADAELALGFLFTEGLIAGPRDVGAISQCGRPGQEGHGSFSCTGGLHAAAVRGADGALLAAAEDVGRHNAVDKVVGALLRRRLLGRGEAGPPLSVLAVSGRASFEIVQKAAMAGVACVASISAPSSLAVDLAERAGIVLLGFVRGGGWNAYAHAAALDLPGEADGRRPGEF